MNQQARRVEVIVEELGGAAPGLVAGLPSVVIETESRVDGEMRETSIEVRESDAPAVAAALLNADVEQPTATSDLPVAVQCLAIGMVHTPTEGQVRLHLQFESGQVLPIELSTDAARALSRVLGGHVDNGSLPGSLSFRRPA